MEVTKKNFKQVFPDVERAISSADFVTIDGEFTGLNNGPTTSPYDSPAQYYDKIRKGSMDFLLIQFGLCAFKYDKVTKSFTYQAFNFYVFPKPFHSSAPDTRFLCQSTSIDFLISNGFDFNKLFRDGIPYLTKKEHGDQEARLKSLQEQRRNSNSDNSPARGKIVIPTQLAEVVHSTCSQIEAFLLDNDTVSNELEFPKLNSFVRKLIYQEMYAKFPKEKFVLDTKVLPDKTYVLVAKKGKSKEDFEIERCTREFEELENAVGFSAVISLLTKYDPPIVGHNMFLDLCHLVKRFCLPLPEDYTSFKQAVHCIFPKIFDTKYLSSQPPLRDLITSSVLGQLLDTIKKPPFTFVPCEPINPDTGYSLMNEKYHEAGYDAYVTGLVFLSLSTYLGTLAKPHTFPVTLDSPLLKKYRNKLFLMKLQDYPYVCLEGMEPVPDRSHVFHVTFPEAWQTDDLVDLFSKYGPVNVSWVNNSSAFVALHKKEEKSHVINNLVNDKKLKGKLRRKYTVIPYDEYSKEEHNRQHMPIHNSTSKRKRTDSNESNSSINQSTKKSSHLSHGSSPASSNGKSAASSSGEQDKTSVSKEFEENGDWD